MRSVQIILNAILSKNIFDYILVDRDLRVINASEGVQKYLGEYPQRGKDVVEYLPEFVGQEEDIREIFVKKFCLYSLEIVNKNDYYLNITVEYSDNDTAIVLLHNVTATTLAKQNLLQYSNESSLLYCALQKVVDNQNALIFLMDTLGISFANKHFLDYFKIENANDISERHLGLYEHQHRQFKEYDLLLRCIENNDEHVKIGDDTFLMQVTQIEPIHKLFTLTKITELSKRAERDDLTGIYGKSYFNEKFEKMVYELQPCVLVIMDIDHFKTINDTYGHMAGDVVLMELVGLVQSMIREDDLFARWGGEEFMLLFNNKDAQKVHTIVEKIRKAIEAHKFTTIGHLTSSFGIAQLRVRDDTHALFKRADKALYEAKAQGRNQIVLCDPEKSNLN